MKIEIFYCRIWNFARFNILKGILRTEKKKKNDQLEYITIVENPLKTFCVLEK